MPSLCINRSEIFFAEKLIITFFQQELETALANVTMKFNSHNYKQVQQAYNSLGKSEVGTVVILMYIDY